MSKNTVWSIDSKSRFHQHLCVYNNMDIYSIFEPQRVCVCVSACFILCARFFPPSKPDSSLTGAPQQNLQGSIMVHRLVFWRVTCWKVRCTKMYQDVPSRACIFPTFVGAWLFFEKSPAPWGLLAPPMAVDHVLSLPVESHGKFHIYVDSGKYDSGWLYFRVNIC